MAVVTDFDILTCNVLGPGINVNTVGNNSITETPRRWRPSPGSFEPLLHRPINDHCRTNQVGFNTKLQFNEIKNGWIMDGKWSTLKPLGTIMEYIINGICRHIHKVSISASLRL